MCARAILFSLSRGLPRTPRRSFGFASSVKKNGALFEMNTADGRRRADMLPPWLQHPSVLAQQPEPPPVHGDSHATAGDIEHAREHQQPPASVPKLQAPAAGRGARTLRASSARKASPRAAAAVRV